MSTKKQSLVKDKINLHHAYLIEGDFETRKEEVFDFLQSLGVVCQGNPNVFCRDFENFTIDDSRLIKGLQIETPTEGESRFFILGAGSITGEAQNALLKVFEEPAPGVHFFLITPSSHILLDTLMSRLAKLRPTRSIGEVLCTPEDVASSTDRLQVHAIFGQARAFQPIFHQKNQRVRGGAQDEANKAEDFIKLKKPARLTFIEKMIKKAGEDKAGLKREVGDLLNGLELLFSQEKPEKLKNLDFEIGEILNCRKYLRDQGASVKMLLEHLAIILPER